MQRRAPLRGDGCGASGTRAGRLARDDQHLLRHLRVRAAVDPDPRLPGGDPRRAAWRPARWRSRSPATACRTSSARRRMAGMLAATPERLRGLAPLSHLLLGGEALPGPLADRLAATVAGEVRNLYGPTETTIFSLGQRVERGEAKPLIGRPLSNTEVYLLDAALRPVPLGARGEVFLGGDGVAMGYWRRARSHRRALPARSAGEPPGRPPLPDGRPGAPPPGRQRGLPRPVGPSGQGARSAHGARRDRGGAARASGGGAGRRRRPRAMRREAGS